VPIAVPGIDSLYIKLSDPVLTSQYGIFQNLISLGKSTPKGQFWKENKLAVPNVE